MKQRIALENYGVSYEGVGFRSGKKNDPTLLIRAETFSQFIQIIRQVSLKTAFLLTVFKRILLRHKPLIGASFQNLAQELDTSPEVLRRYAKQFQQEGLLHFKKLAKKDSTIPDEYVFTMGPKFENWMWNSRLFEKAKRDHVDNSQPHVDKFSDPKSQTVHYGLSDDPKQSTTDCQTVHYGPQSKMHIGDILKQIAPGSALSSLSPSLYLSSQKAGERDTDVSLGKREPKREPRDMNLQKRWLNDTQGTGLGFEEWKAARGL